MRFGRYFFLQLAAIPVLHKLTFKHWMFLKYLLFSFGFFL